MNIEAMYREIINEHNLHPVHKHETKGADLVLRGVNPSCGDDIYLQFRIDHDMITDGSYIGSGCAISQASADLMLDLAIGRSREEALHLCDVFERMIRGEASEDELDELGDAGALETISHMPARVKCALLGWRTMGKMLRGQGD